MSTEGDLPTLLGRMREIGDSALVEIRGAPDERALEELRIARLGKKSELNQLLRQMGKLGEDDRPQAGKVANEIKEALSEALTARRATLAGVERSRRLREETLDITLPGRPQPSGGLHPLTQGCQEILAIFSEMGFEVVSGPDLEDEFHNFEALNTPPWHPARDLQDTLYVDYPRVLMRTQATAYQARVLPRTSAPVRLLNVGRCHRSEATDATHEWMFYQIDGLVVDKGVTMSDLRGTLTTFATRFFGRPVKTRFRCDYFPFVEPGVDFAISCHRCDGDGGPSCPICHGSGWLELLGAGMVHPKVLDNVGYDSTVYSGFAWGMGVDRLTLVKHGITDIRMFYANDVRFLEQF